jgi:hypothetical protein
VPSNLLTFKVKNALITVIKELENYLFIFHRKKEDLRNTHNNINILHKKAMDILEHGGLLFIAERDPWEKEDIYRSRVMFLRLNLDHDGVSYQELISWSHIWASKHHNNSVFADTIEEKLAKMQFMIPT